MEGLPIHVRGIGTRWSFSPFQLKLCYDSMEFNVNKHEGKHGEYQSSVSLHTDIYWVSKYSSGKKCWRCWHFSCEKWIQRLALVKNANLYMPFKQIDKQHKINNCYSTMIQTPTHLYRQSWSFNPKEDLDKAKKEQKGQYGQFCHRNWLNLLSFKRDDPKKSIIKLMKWKMSRKKE